MTSDEIIACIWLAGAVIIMVVGIYTAKHSETKTDERDIFCMIMFSILWPILLILACIAAPVVLIGHLVLKWINKGIKDPQ